MGFQSSLMANKPLFTSIERLSIAEGLPTTSVYSIFTDKTGFIWLGTPKGLVRYDGSRFHTFSAESTSDFSIPTTDTSNAFIDSKGRFWLGSWGKGAFLFDANMQPITVFKRTPSESDALQSNRIQAFFEDSKGRIWIESNGGGLAVFNEKRMSFRNYLHQPDNQNSLSHNRVWSIAEDKQGRIWAGTTDGLNVLENENQGLFTRFYHQPEEQNSLNNSLVRKIHIDNNDRLWVGTETGFGEFDKATHIFTSHEPREAPVNSGITVIKSGPKSKIWVGTQKGIYLFNPDNNQFQAISTDNQFALLAQDDLRDLIFDKKGIMWIATRYGGLVKVQFKPGVFNGVNQYKLADNKTQQMPQVLSFYKDRDNKLWLGTQAGLMVSDSPGSPPRHFALPNMPDIRGIRDLTEGPDDELWIASEKGLFVLSKNRDQIVSKSDLLGGLNSPGVSQVVFTSDGAIWLATKLEGALRYHNGRRHHYKRDENDSSSLSYDVITKIFEDRQKRVWVGTGGGGLNQFIPFKNRFIRYESQEGNPNSLSNDSVREIFQASDNSLWIGTRAGLNKFDEVNASFVSFDTNEGMRNSNIRGIVEDSTGNIWFSTDFGITEFRIDKQYFVNYELSDKLHGLEFSTNAALTLEPHSFVFGGRGGYTQVNLQYIDTDSQLPNIEITQAWIDRVQQKQLHISDTMPRLVLPSATREIRFDFSTLDFVNPGNNRYQYRLLGLDEDWSPTSFEPYARFTGLRYGDYVFEVRGANSNGRWSEQPASLKFSLPPPLWLTLWFQLTVTACIILLIVFWYKQRTRSLKAQKRLLEQEISTRTEALVNAQKQLIESEKHHALSSLVTGVAHELNTPVGVSITAITTLNEAAISLAESVDQDKVKKTQLRQKLQHIRESSDLVLRNLNRAGELVRSFKEVAVDQVLDERRVFDLHAYLKEIIISVEPRLRKQNIDITLNCPDDIKLDSYPGAIAQIMTHLLLNALNHGFVKRIKGKIEVSASLEDDFIYIDVKDDGKGIPEQNIRKVFDPFFTTSRASGANGLGLHIVQNLINVRLQGSIVCESEFGKGTLFSMEFKAKPD